MTDPTLHIVPDLDLFYDERTLPAYRGLVRERAAQLVRGEISLGMFVDWIQAGAEAKARATVLAEVQDAVDGVGPSEFIYREDIDDILAALTQSEKEQP